MITTIYGSMDEASLIKKEGAIDNENEHTTWVEYYLNGECVHRSAHITLKHGISAEAVAASMGA